MLATKLPTDLKTTPNLLTTAGPFVKWAGGKTQLLGQFEDLFPPDFNNYIEPMVGGGAVFFHLFNNSRIKHDAFLIDSNPELMNCYFVIKEDVDSLILELQWLAEEYNKEPKEFFYRVRKWDRSSGFLRPRSLLFIGEI